MTPEGSASGVRKNQVTVLETTVDSSIIECWLLARHHPRNSRPRRTQSEEVYMSIYETSRSPWTGRMLSICRIVTGLVFMSYGTMKLFNIPPAPMPGFPVKLVSEMGAAGSLETIGGLAIVLGLFTRPVAFI